MENKERQEAIREKGFDMNGATDYGKIKVGIKTLEDAIIDLASNDDKKISVSDYESNNRS